MNDYLDDAKEELKRVDHQIYVSLKYTRTVDVLLNVMNRMIEAYDFMFDGLLEFSKEKKIITDLPKTPKEKATVLKTQYSEAIVHENIDLFLLLRKLVKTGYERENEFRRHVTMITYIDGQQEIINIDIITQYYHMQREFLQHLEKVTE
ncbi:MAG: hypothetical protein KKG59_04155 [Nanoarchaeota archaeon]|nr:hypothetical protein [Nanoarchaeota archaeon]